MARALVLLLLAAVLAACSQAFLMPTPLQQQPQTRRAWQAQPQQLQELRAREALPLVSRPQSAQQAALAPRGA